MYSCFLESIKSLFEKRLQKKIIIFLIIFFSPIVLFAKEVLKNNSKGMTTYFSNLNLLEAILSASIIVQITLLILSIMSIVSWAIVFQKYFFFRELQKSNSFFENIFLTNGSFEEIYRKARSNETSSLAQIFIGGYNEMQKIFQSNSPSKILVRSSEGLDNIERALRKACENELSLMESGLGFLATVGSSGPFIGLFGTVFGIMNSFNKIAVMGSASLNVVAPGIAEALLATGVGLFAAIPASIFYNSYLSKIKKMDLAFNNFTVDFLNIARRNFFQDKE